jgi:hypothetical protein
MEIKVRALDSSEGKSIQEVEKELLEKHEKEMNGEQTNDIKIDTSNLETSTEQTKEDEPELTEEQVLSYIGKRYNKQINSFDELVSERQESDPLPEDVAAYMKFKKETGRGFDDFIKVNKDYDEMEPDQVLREYLASTQKGLDKEDIDVLMEDYSYD